MATHIPTRSVATAAAVSPLLLASLIAVAQPAPTSTSPLAPPANGPRRVDIGLGATAITNATVHISPTQTVDRATVVFRDGRIVSVSSVEGGVSGSPAGATVRDYAGMHIYAGFLEPYLDVEVPRPDVNAPGSHWNPRVTPQRNALDKGSAGVDKKTGETLRSLGFVAAAISPQGGIFRGTSALVSLAPTSPDASESEPRVYADRVYQMLSFELASGGRRGDAERIEEPDTSRWPRYPDSEMGAIALVRQTLSDADWQTAQRAGGKKEPANALDALDAARSPAFLFDAQDELAVLRAAAVADEFKRPLMILGSGVEFRRLDAIAKPGRSIVLPLNFPQRPRVGTLGEADAVSLRDLMTWEQAPTNPRRLDAAGLTVALTTSKIPERIGGRAAFKDRLSTAIKHGLAPDHALAMLTTNAAKVLNASDRFGTLEPGKAASFVVADGALFADRPDAPGKDEPGFVRPAKIVETWIDGARFPVSPKARHDLTGTWEVAIDAAVTGQSAKITLAIDEQNSATIHKAWTDEAGKEQRATVKVPGAQFDDESLGGRFKFGFEHEPFGEKGVFLNSGVIERQPDGSLVMSADAQRSGGQRFTWSARRVSTAVPPSSQLDRRKFSFNGTWVLVNPVAPAPPDAAIDTANPRVIISQDRTVSVKKGDKEFPTETVKFEEGLVVYTVKGLDADKPEGTTVYLRPVKDLADRIGASLAENEPEQFRLARHRERPETAEIAQTPAKLGLPFGAYALEQLPAQGTFVITGGTVWTCTDKNPEIIEDAVVVISGGAIAAVGRAGEAKTPQVDGSRLIDARGKHITPGIIDCHSHTGISRGVNESGQAVTAEVRIGDVTDPDSISWYRQLGGGVTTVNNLHGSANAIGGQNQVNKNRWGVATPAEMHFAGALPGIKFALGENPKQSNWGDRMTTRYPQTRMGVESLIRDRFTAAKEYNQRVNEGTARRDLELEALGEILDGKRLVHCHSYRQDEILMLCRVARDFGFKIGTFQHGLECYKVADEVAQNARGASLFSDWWAYKMEVVDAIPYAGPILAERGVPVSYNSDSDELARRLNVEAGKAIKYSHGRLRPEDALKFVTLNPARQLAIDARVGSLEAGKDADVVIWSGPPMSSMSRAEMTFVDGRPLFSLARDAELREANERERHRVIQKILAIEKRSGGPGGERDRTGDRPADPPPPVADDEPANVASGADDRAGGRRSLIMESVRAAERAREQYFLDLLKHGIDSQFHRGGECGCAVWMNH